VVTFSGDKLLGGPQAGMISGRKDLVGRIRQNPMFRALRVDKLIYAALEATLLAYVQADYDAIPTVRMMRLSKESIAERARRIVATLKPGLKAEIVDGESVVGGGAAPASSIPTVLLAIASDRHGATELANQLRHSKPPIIARVEEDRLLIDLRTVHPNEDEFVVAALAALA